LTGAYDTLGYDVERAIALLIQKECQLALDSEILKQKLA
jgi:hypothetical protein